MFRVIFQIILGIVGITTLLMLSSIVFLRQSGGERAPPDVVVKIDGMNLLTTQHRGAPAPAGKIIAQDGTIGDLSFFKGKLALLYLWSPEKTVSSIIEFEGLAKLAAKINNPDFVIVPIAVTANGWGGIEAFTRRHPVQVPLYLDAAFAQGGIFRFYALPTSLIIGPDGTEIARLSVPAMWDSPRAVALIDSILKNIHAPQTAEPEPSSPAPTTEQPMQPPAPSQDISTDLFGFPTVP